MASPHLILSPLKPSLPFDGAVGRADLVSIPLLELLSEKVIGLFVHADVHWMQSVCAVNLQGP